MERLRSAAIKQDCGSMVDAEIRPVNCSRSRLLRIVGASQSEGGVALNGLKLIV